MSGMHAVTLSIHSVLHNNPHPLLTGVAYWRAGEIFPQDSL